MRHFLLVAAFLSLAPMASAAPQAPNKPARAPATLETTIERLRRATGANIVPMWGAIEQAGIKRDTPIELHVKHVSAGQCLRLALGIASAGKEKDDRLDYAVRDGVIVVAPRKFLADQAELRIYDTLDLEASVPNFTDAPSLGLPTGSSSLFNAVK